MKKKIILTLIILATLIFSVSSVSAYAPGGNIKGEVTVIGVGSLVVLKGDGTLVNVTLPAGFDTTGIEVGSDVLIRGEAQEDGSIIADSVKGIGNPNAADGDGPGKSGGNDNKGPGNNSGKNNEEDAGLANNPFCSGEKEDSHPLSIGLSETYGVDAEEIASLFCGGNGFGSIMLALQTVELNGGDVASLLAARGEGSGWGQIWNDLGLVGNQEDADTPPGHLKRPEWAGPPEGKGPSTEEPTE